MADHTTEAYRRRDEVIEMAVRLANRIILEHCRCDFAERGIVTAFVAHRLLERAMFWMNHELARQEFERKENPAP